MKMKAQYIQYIQNLWYTVKAMPSEKLYSSKCLYQKFCEISNK